MIYVLIAGGIFVIDLLLKNKIEQKIQKGEQKEILKGKIQIKKLHNRGAALNFLEKKPELIQKISFVVTAGVGICFFISLFKKGYTVLKLGLSFLLGGALSNLYDRIFRGYVVDYFSFHTKVKRISKIVFNIADMFIFLGAILVAVWDVFRSSK